MVYVLSLLLSLRAALIFLLHDVTLDVFVWLLFVWVMTWNNKAPWQMLGVALLR